MKKFHCGLFVMLAFLLASAPSAWPAEDSASFFAQGEAAYDAKEYSQAVDWYRKAAEQGHLLAQNNLGHMYQHGLGVTQDNEQAVAWYRKAAEQGYANAQNDLGYMYGQGLGVTRDDGQAAAWYRKAAEQGYDLAQSNLGHMYQHGLGVTQDDKQAAVWYRKAAEQGNRVAQFTLGCMYDEGKGVEGETRAKTVAQAIKYYKMAARQGDKQAQQNLALRGIDSWDDSPAVAEKKPQGGSSAMVEQKPPANARYSNSTGRPGKAPFEIKSSGTGYYFIKLVDLWTGKNVKIFVHAGKPLKVEIPFGEYEMKYAYGQAWYGEEHLFGPETVYSQTDAAFNFHTKDFGFSATGYTVTLYAVSGGNMRNYSIAAEQF